MVNPIKTEPLEQGYDFFLTALTNDYVAPDVEKNVV